jgi:hypothetical protein
MEALCSPETLISTYKSTQHNNPEDQHRHFTVVTISYLTLNLNAVGGCALDSSSSKLGPLERLWECGKHSSRYTKYGELPDQLLKQDSAACSYTEWSVFCGSINTHSSTLNAMFVYGPCAFAELQVLGRWQHHAANQMFLVFSLPSVLFYTLLKLLCVHN